MSRPKSALLTGFIALACSFLLSPSFFIWLGPLRTSLLSEVESVRVVAELEVLAARLLFFGLALLSLASWFFWPQLSRSKVMQRISQHQIDTPLMPDLLNSSLKIMSIFFFLIIVVVAIAGFFPGFWTANIMEEDGLIEYATAFIFLACSIFSGYLAHSLSARRRRLVHAFLCIGFFLCFGEEISWGQRILDYNTPEAVQAINVQGEFNIHNSFGYLADHLFIVTVFLYGAVLPIIANNNLFVAKLVDLTGLPLASIGLALGFAMASLLHDWTIYVILPWTPIRIAEPREFLSSIGFLLLMWETYNVKPHHALNMRPPVPETLDQNGTEHGG